MAVAAPNAITQFLAIATSVLPSDMVIRYGTVFNPFPGVDKALLVSAIHFTEDEYAEIAPTYKHEEHFEFMCSLITWAGDDDEMGRMTDTYGFYVAIQVAVANNPTLNGSVRLAWPRQLNYNPTTDGKGGSLGQLDFEIQCQQRVDSLD